MPARPVAGEHISNGIIDKQVIVRDGGPSDRTEVSLEGYGV